LLGLVAAFSSWRKVGEWRGFSKRWAETDLHPPAPVWQKPAAVDAGAFCAAGPGCSGRGTETQPAAAVTITKRIGGRRGNMLLIML
jgi:hypothetical protein